eukprot:365573-Rhodomonas_salina.1
MRAESERLLQVSRQRQRCRSQGSCETWSVFSSCASWRKCVLSDTISAMSLIACDCRHSLNCTRHQLSQIPDPDSHTLRSLRSCLVWLNDVHQDEP